MGFESVTVLPTIATTTGGAPFWNTLATTNIFADDGSVADQLFANTTSAGEALEGTGITHTIPGRARIVGLSASIDRRQFAGGIVAVDSVVRLLINSTRVGDNKASAAAWPTTFATATYGSTADLWGLTEAELRSVNGIVLSVYQQTSGLALVDVDYMSLTWHYSIEPPLRYTRRPYLTMPGSQQPFLK